MQEMGAFEAKTHFSSLLAQVEQGQEFVITKHGHPIAKLVSINACERKNVRLAIQRLKTFCQTQTLDELDWKSLRDEGRR